MTHVYKAARGRSWSDEAPGPTLRLAADPLSYKHQGQLATTEKKKN